MTNELALLVSVAVAVICGAVTGRVFALEGENRRTSIFAAAYCGAGAGLLSAPLLAFLLVLTASAMHSEQGLGAALFSAGEAFGPALLWGTAGGAAGGLAVGVVVALFRRYTPR